MVKLKGRLGKDCCNDLDGIQLYYDLIYSRSTCEDEPSFTLAREIRKEAFVAAQAEIKVKSLLFTYNARTNLLTV